MTSSSCNRDLTEVENDLVENNTSLVAACQDYFENITIQNGMLVFTDEQHFIDVFDCLTQTKETYISNFNESYNNLSDSLFWQYADSLGYDEDTISQTFENEFNFYSLRKLMQSKEEAWSNTEPLDWRNYPTHPVYSEIYRTLLNTNGDVKVGNSIFSHCENGAVYEITDGDLEYLTAMHDGSFVYNDSMSNITIHSEPYDADLSKASDCKSNKNVPKNKDVGTYIGKYDIGIGWTINKKRHAYAKSKGFDHNGKSKALQLRADILVDFYDNNCSNQEQHGYNNDPVSGNRKSLEKTIRADNNNYRCPKNSIIGYHDVNQSCYSQLNFTW